MYSAEELAQMNIVGLPLDLYECEAHRYHSPRPQYWESHHVLPMGWGGPPDGLQVPLCPTGHANVHVLLAAFKRVNGAVSWTTLRSFGPGERDVAALGWSLLQEMNG